MAFFSYIKVENDTDMRNELVSIPLTEYAHKYLLKCFGPAPFDLTKPGFNPPRDMFLSVGIIWSRTSNIFPFESVDVFLGSTQHENMLHKHYRTHQKKFELGIYGLYYFYRALFNEVDMEIKLREEMGQKLGYGDNHISKAVDNFLKRYDIDEEIYPLAAAYQKYMRMKQKHRIQNLSFSV